MKVLIVGLGSMGKRRIRNFQALGNVEVAGYDVREDRRTESVSRYGIMTFEKFEEAITTFSPDALIISVPPDLHHVFIEDAITRKIPAFIEASVVDTSLPEIIKRMSEMHVLLAPSTTLLFHPAIQRIRKVVESGELGRIAFVSYHSGQYLPDWHSYESVADFYVSKKETGGAREIVPFELSWMTQVFGFPKEICGRYYKAIDIPGAEAIDDTYTALLNYPGFSISLTVDVTSRIGTRRLLINGSEKQLRWDWDLACVEIYDPKNDQWDKYHYEALASADGYNKNITEQMYIDEMQAFLNAVQGTAVFPNNMMNDWQVLKLLYALEESSDKGKVVSI